MRDYYGVVLALGVGLAVTIFVLARRDHLYIRQSVFWAGVALVSMLLGAWPSLLDKLAGLVGIAYSPALLFLLAIIVLTVKSLLTDIALTEVKRDLRRLNQALALQEVGKQQVGKQLDEDL